MKNKAKKIFGIGAVVLLAVSGVLSALATIGTTTIKITSVQTKENKVKAVGAYGDLLEGGMIIYHVAEMTPDLALIWLYSARFKKSIDDCGGDPAMYDPPR